MKTFQRILAVVLALVMSLSVIGVAAFAATTDVTIDKSAKGSITITKYEYNGTATLANGDGTTNVTIPEGATVLPGVTFTAYKVMDADAVVAYYSGSTDNVVTVADYVTNGEINSEYAGTAVTATTNTQGVATFSDLAVGMYVIIETAHPNKVTDPADPFLVSIPMTNPSDKTEWMYDVHVYPKNSTSVGNVTFVKTDADGNKLSDVTVNLYKKYSSTSWNLVTDETTNNAYFTTDVNGEIKWNALVHGDYYIAEVRGLTGYIVDCRPIYFTVNKDNTITCTDDRATISLEGAGTASMTITLMNEKPKVEKTADADEKNIAGVGDTIDYTVTVSVPHEIAILGDYTITDDPYMLKVQENTISVKCGDTELTKGTHYTLTYDTPKDGYTIKLNNSEMAPYAGQTMTITYTALILEEAASNGKATNEVKLSYNSVIEADGTPGTPKDITDTEETYLHNATITKKLQGTVNNADGDVKFVLYEDKDLTNPVEVIQHGNGQYMVSDHESTSSEVTEMTVYFSSEDPSTGKLYITGLAKKTYYLVETETKTGFNLLSGSVELKVGDETDYQFETTVINKQGFTLPQTGGIGTLMFIILGGVLIAGGVCLIAVPNKKRSV